MIGAGAGTVVALSDSVTVTLVVVGALVLLALLALLRVLLRKEPTPARWRRFRLGVFVERDPADDEHGHDA